MEEFNFEKKIVNKIVEARIFLDISRENYAKLFDMSNSAFSKLEKGSHKMFVQRLIDIANAIKVDISYFFNNEPYPEAVINYLDNRLEERQLQNGTEHYRTERRRELTYRFLGGIKKNENIQQYLSKLNFYDEDFTNRKTDIKNRIGNLLGQLSTSELYDFYSLALWYMRSQGYESSHTVERGVYRD